MRKRKTSFKEATLIQSPLWTHNHNVPLLNKCCFLKKRKKKKRSSPKERRKKEEKK